MWLVVTTENYHTKAPKSSGKWLLPTFHKVHRHTTDLINDVINYCWFFSLKTKFLTYIYYINIIMALCPRLMSALRELIQLDFSNLYYMASLPVLRIWIRSVYKSREQKSPLHRPYHHCQRHIFQVWVAIINISSSIVASTTSCCRPRSVRPTSCWTHPPMRITMVILLLFYTYV